MSKKPLALISALAFAFSSLVAQPAVAAVPNLTSVSPASGTVSGGTSITLTGTDFTGATGATIGGVAVTDFVVVSDTSITAKTPLRNGTSRKIGRSAIVVQHADGNSSQAVFFDYSPVYETQNIVVGNNSAGRILLGDLASRTQGKPIVRNATTPPLTVTGTDSNTGESYTYVFERRGASDFTNAAAYSREGIEANSTNLQTSFNANASFASRTGVLELSSDGNCPEPQPRDQYYCSVFGPDVYTQAFYAEAGQSISFDWAASDASDAFEIYAFLVAVNDLNTIPTASLSNHSVATHAQGGLTGWRTVTVNIPSTGYWRLRTVNGSYDETGGEAIGARFYLASVVNTGLNNVISFGPFSDWVVSSSGETKNITVSATSGAQVTITSIDTSKCTVGSPTHANGVTTYVLTRNGTATGECQLKASQGATGLYAPASDVFQAFTIRTSAITANAPFISSLTPADGSITVKFLPPTRDGGSAITNYQYQLNGGAWVTLSPASTATTFTITGLTNGTSYSVVIRAVNSAGSGSSSNSVSATPNVPAAPAIADYSATLGVNSFGTVTAPANTGGSIATWSISPALPSGLSFNTSTGVITGSATSIIPATPFTVTATNSSNVSDTAVLTLTVADTSPPVISYQSPQVLNLNVSATITPTSSGGVVTSWAVTTGTLPTGLSINTSTGVISGTPSSLSNAVNVTVTATNSFGTSTATISISVSGAAPSAPRELTANFRNGNTTLLGWTAPADNGGSPITGYVVQVFDGTNWNTVSATGLTAETGFGSQSTWSFRVAATNAIGTGPWAVFEYRPASYTGPILMTVTPNPLNAEEPQQVATIRGERLDTIQNLSFDGKPVLILFQSEKEITVSLPSSLAGQYDLVAVQRGGGKLTAQQFLTFVSNLNSPTNLKPSNRIVITGFRPSITKPTEFQLNKLRAGIAAVKKEIIAVTCVGFTNGPVITPDAPQIALARGKFICDSLQDLLPGIPQKLTYRNTTRPSVHWRRAEVYLVTR